jgi:pilus assembly protein Flp/PilA
LNHVVKVAAQLYPDEKGQGMAEYGLILVLVGLAVIGGLTLLGTKLYSKFSDVNEALGN